MFNGLGMETFEFPANSLNYDSLFYLSRGLSTERKTMSGWTVATLRAREGKDYEYSKYDGHDPVSAVEDIVATVENDDRVFKWTMDSPHIYVYLNCDRYNWEFAEQFLEDYQFMVNDAVVLGANDTTDTGTARYYPVKNEVRCTDEYKETQARDGYYVGRHALNVISANHTILARDPFHDWLGRLDDKYKGKGTDRL